MRVLVTGAYGLIGSACLARLHRDGHELVGAGRSLDEAQRRFPYAQWIVADFARLTAVAAWRPLLRDIDAVVNCVGVLQDGLRDDTHRVHVDATCALFEACAQASNMAQVASTWTRCVSSRRSSWSTPTQFTTASISRNNGCQAATPVSRAKSAAIHWA